MIIIYKNKEEYDRVAGSMTNAKADFVAFAHDDNQFSVIKSRYTAHSLNVYGGSLIDLLKTTIQHYSDLSKKKREVYFETLPDGVEEIVVKGIRYKKQTKMTWEKVS
jgi:hypothetical protein